MVSKTLLFCSSYQYLFVPFVVQHEDSLEKVNDFIVGISLELSKTCDCYIPVEYFAHERLICETKQTDKVVFQSRLVVTSDKNTAELLETLKQWVRTSPHLVIQGIQLNVDEYCSVEVPELGDGECVSTTTALPPETTATTTQNMNETEKSESLAHESVEVPVYALGGSAGGLVLIIIIAAIAFTFCIALRCMRR